MSKTGSILICLVYFAAGWGQVSTVDSLKQVIRRPASDTDRVHAYLKYAFIISKTNTDSGIILTNTALKISQAANWQRGIMYSYYRLGVYNFDKGNYSQAEDFYLKSLALSGEGSKNQAEIMGNLGNVYNSLGIYPKAFEMYTKALYIFENIKNKEGIMRNLAGIAGVHMSQKEYGKSLEFYTKALLVAKELKLKTAQAAILSNIGNAHTQVKQFTKALEYYNDALKINTETGNLRFMATNLDNIGAVYANWNQHVKAIEYRARAIEIAKKSGDIGRVAIALHNQGISFVRMRQFKNAEKCLFEALTISAENGARGLRSENYNALSDLFEAKGDYSKALIYYRRYIESRDSIYNEENTRKLTQTEMQYEFDKKEAAARLEQDRKEALAVAYKNRQNLILFSISCFGLLVLGFAIFAYRSFLQKRRANIAISKQKELIEEKQKEILDSIYYARRIQRSLLPSERYIHRIVSKKG